MNRALLERLREYQPQRGLASRGDHFNVAFWAIAFCVVVVVVYPAMILVNGCSPAATNAQIEVGAGAGDYGIKIHGCFLKAADGGTFRDFQKCACDVDREFGLDASSAGAVCP